MARIVLGLTMNQNDPLLAAVTPAQGNTALGLQRLLQDTVEPGGLAHHLPECPGLAPPL